MIYAITVHTPFNWKRPSTILPHLIRKVTKNFYNHAGIIYDKDGELHYYQAIGKGVKEPLLIDEMREQTISAYLIPDEKWIREKMEKELNTKYDFKGLLWYELFYALTGKFFGNPNMGDKRFYCYEIVAFILGLKDYYKILPSQFISQMNQSYKMTHDRVKIQDFYNDITTNAIK